MGFSLEDLRNKRIAVLLGGLSAEREVSIRTGDAVVRALTGRGYDVTRLDVGRDIAVQLAAAKPDVAFIALHGRYGEDGCIQGLLESAFVPYTGSGVLASAAAMDKVFTKRLFRAEGVPVAKYVAVPRGARIEARDLPFGLPCVVKPSREGSSVGVAIVRTEAELAPAIAEASKYVGEILIEEYVKGQEINVAVLFGEALGAIEIRSSREFYDYTAKYTPGMTQYLFPAPLPPEQYAAVMALGARAHAVLGCDGASRADFIIAPDGRIICLEVNTLPGMTETSLLPKIAAGQGLDFATLCERLLCGASLKA